MGKDPLARAGLAALLAREASLEILGHLAPEDLPEAIPGQQVDALAFDAQGGVEPLRDLDADLPAVALVDDETQAAEAVGAGARGVVLRSAGPAQIAACLAAVAQDLFAASGSLATALLRPRLPGGAAAALPDALTPRELEVLGLLSLGLANKAIASRLSISDHTAKFHVNAILGKLGVQSRSEAIVRASRLGLVVL